MRTTLTIDDDVLTAAREIAQQRQTTVGKAVSNLARRALDREAVQADQQIYSWHASYRDDLTYSATDICLLLCRFRTE